MTISNQIRTAGPFSGNDTTTVFPFSFKVFNTSDLMVVRTDTTTGITTPLILDSDYSAVLNIDQNASPGGTVTLLIPLATGLKLVLTSSLPYLQPVDLTNQGGFFPIVINTALDRLTIFCQQLASLASRSLRFPLSDSGVNTELPSANVRANNILGFDSNGNPIAVVPISGSAADVTASILTTYAASNGASRIGFIQAETGAVAQTVQSKLRRYKDLEDYNNIANYLLAAETNKFFVQNGATVARFPDRVFMGAAVHNDGRYPNVSKDWLGVFQNSLGYDAGGGGATAAQVCVLNDSSNSSGGTFVSGARSKNFTSAGTAALAVTGIAVNDNTTYRADAWAFYGEAHLATNNAGSVYGMEVDTRSVIQTLTSDPYHQGNVIGHQIAAGCGIGSTVVIGKIDNGSGAAGTILTVTAVTTTQIGGTIRIGSNVSGVGIVDVTQVQSQVSGTPGGIGVYTVNQTQLVASERLVVSTDQYDSSAAVQIVANAMRFKIGINFFADSLSGCDGVTGVGTAIGMAKGHEMAWYQSGGQKTGYVRGNGTFGGLFKSGILFDDNGSAFADSAANPILRATSSGALAADYLLVQSGVAGSSAVSISAMGTDTNIDISFFAKGTGTLRFGTYVAAALSQTGHIIVKDSGGTVRRLLVG